MSQTNAPACRQAAVHGKSTGFAGWRPFAAPSVGRLRVAEGDSRPGRRLDASRVLLEPHCERARSGARGLVAFAG